MDQIRLNPISLAPASLTRFAIDGALRVDRATTTMIPDLEAALAHLPRDKAGIRIADAPALSRLLAPSSTIGHIASRALGREAHAVRAVLFDKTPDANWSLGWHQDRTICVKRRVESPGFGPWTIKDGRWHVTPPIGLLSRMATLRVHLDPVGVDNAPLLIAPGSHLLGRIAECNINAVVERLGTVVCRAEMGDVWAYATLTLHASPAARQPTRRRVLQIDFATEALPGRLEWSGL